MRKFILFTNGKCGGTTIKRWFLKNLNLDLLINDSKKLEKLFGKEFCQTIQGYILDKHKITELSDDVSMLRRFIDIYRNEFCINILNSREIHNYFKVIVARNPYNRIISSFLDKFCGDDMQRLFVTQVNKKLECPDISFYDFLRYLETTNEEHHNPHWRRQTYIIDNIQLDAVIHLENIKHDFTSYQQILGSDYLYCLDEKLQTTSYTNTELDIEQAPNLKQSQLLDFKSKYKSYPSPKGFLNNDCRKKTYNIYKKDFIRLSYDVNFSTK